MKILVAGASGAIGRVLTPLLTQAGHQVFGTTRHADHATALEAAGVRPVIVDVFDQDKLSSAVFRVRPEVIIHQLTDLSAQNFEANARLRIDGTRHLVEAAHAAGVRRMIAQSIAFAYEPGDEPADETTPLDYKAGWPRKRTVEAVVSLEQAAGEVEQAVILRYGVLYGPGTGYARDGQTAEGLRRGSTSATRAVSCFLHIEDAARAAVAALDWPAKRLPTIVNVVDDEPAAATEWMPVLAESLGVPAPAVDRQAPVSGRAVSNAKARGVLGWTPRYPTWRTGFAAALA
jgi:nucleoside-diphosphate-sugar epimerase